jgi:hypothetical protein
MVGNGMPSAATGRLDGREGRRHDAGMNRQAPTVREPATYQDVLDAPPNMVAELIRDALHLRPRPASPHALAGTVLAAELGGPFHRGRGGPLKR